MAWAGAGRPSAAATVGAMSVMLAWTWPSSAGGSTSRRETRVRLGADGDLSILLPPGILGDGGPLELVARAFRPGHEQALDGVMPSRPQHPLQGNALLLVGKVGQGLPGPGRPRENRCRPGQPPSPPRSDRSLPGRGAAASASKPSPDRFLKPVRSVSSRSQHRLLLRHQLDHAGDPLRPARARAGRGRYGCPSGPARRPWLRRRSGCAPHPSASRTRSVSKPGSPTMSARPAPSTRAAVLPLRTWPSPSLRSITSVCSSVTERVGPSSRRPMEVR